MCTLVISSKISTSIQTEIAGFDGFELLYNSDLKKQKLAVDDRINASPSIAGDGNARDRSGSFSYRESVSYRDTIKIETADPREFEVIEAKYHALYTMKDADVTGELIIILLKDEMEITKKIHFTICNTNSFEEFLDTFKALKTKFAKDLHKDADSASKVETRPALRM